MDRLKDDRYLIPLLMALAFFLGWIAATEPYDGHDYGERPGDPRVLYEEQFEPLP